MPWAGTASNSVQSLNETPAVIPMDLGETYDAALAGMRGRSAWAVRAAKNKAYTSYQQRVNRVRRKPIELNEPELEARASPPAGAGPESAPAWSEYANRLERLREAEWWRIHNEERAANPSAYVGLTETPETINAAAAREIEMADALDRANSERATLGQSLVAGLGASVVDMVEDPDRWVGMLASGGAYRTGLRNVVTLLVREAVANSTAEAAVQLKQQAARGEIGANPEALRGATDVAAAGATSALLRGGWVGLRALVDRNIKRPLTPSERAAIDMIERDQQSERGDPATRPNPTTARAHTESVDAAAVELMAGKRPTSTQNMGAHDTAVAMTIERGALDSLRDEFGLTDIPGESDVGTSMLARNVELQNVYNDAERALTQAQQATGEHQVALLAEAQAKRKLAVAMKTIVVQQDRLDTLIAARKTSEQSDLQGQNLVPFLGEKDQTAYMEIETRLGGTEELTPEQFAELAAEHTRLTNKARAKVDRDIKNLQRNLATSAPVEPLGAPATASDVPPDIQARDAATPTPPDPAEEAAAAVRVGVLKNALEVTEAAAPATKTGAVDLRIDNARTMIEKRGGITRSAAVAEGIDPADAAKMRRMFPLSGKYQSMDHLLEGLKEDGYLPDEATANDALAVVDAIMRGEAPMSIHQDATAIGDPDLRKLGTPEQVSTALRKAINGEKLGKQQQAIVDEVLAIHEREVGAYEAHVEDDPMAAWDELTAEEQDVAVSNWEEFLNAVPENQIADSGPGAGGAGDNPANVAGASPTEGTALADEVARQQALLAKLEEDVKVERDATKRQRLVRDIKDLKENLALPLVATKPFEATFKRMPPWVTEEHRAPAPDYTIRDPNDPVELARDARDPADPDNTPLSAMSPVSAERIRVAKEVEKITAKFDKRRSDADFDAEFGVIDQAEYRRRIADIEKEMVDAIIKAHEKFGLAYDAIKEEPVLKPGEPGGPDLQRGLDWFEQKIATAIRNGDIPEPAGQLLLWFARQNRYLVRNAALSIKAMRAGIDGMYQPADRIIQLARSMTTDRLTGVHELLHHAERQMPEELRAGIAAEWSRALTRAIDAAAQSGDNARMDALISIAHDANNAQTKRFEALVKMGVLTDADYKLFGPSEWFTENGSRILAKEYDRLGGNMTRSFWQQVTKWLGDMFEQIKKVLGFPDNSDVVRALNYIADPIANKGEMTGRTIGRGEHWASGLHETLRQFGDAEGSAKLKVEEAKLRTNERLDAADPNWHEADETPYYRSRAKHAKDALASIERELQSPKILDEEDEAGIAEMRGSPGKTLTIAVDGSAREISTSQELAKVKQDERNVKEFEACVFGVEAVA